jgi:2-haloacid dehalogenase
MLMFTNYFPGMYRSFSEITRGALLHAVAEADLSLAPGDADRLMTAYDSLHVFPEIPAALKAVADNKSIEAYIFTNGTNEMAKASVETSPDLGPHAATFKGLITVDELEAFKPDQRTYDHLLSKTGKERNTGQVWVVSANPFDAVGAKAAGLESAWVDRAGKGWIDRLGDVIGGIRPTVVVSGVDEAISEISRRIL